MRPRNDNGRSLADAVRDGTPHGLADDSCWPWQGNVNDTGYGRVCVAGNVTNAHRAAYRVTNGDVPDGLVVRHTCDNRRCVNPKHLILGTQGDNVRDMLWQRSPRAFGRRLTERDIIAIRRAHVGGTSRRAIAEQYGINYAHACGIISGQRWAHVPS
ncbi:HNH endonuclease [Gordonia phage BobBob]|uniref:HNH endonuclease n=3 Tax=Vividuovirus TaxID=2560251 RepID=A0A3G3MAR5_9CAUD|nr:endonuclease [Gordonia phage Rofo]YP_010099450.1 endonuclease [Gordonia phage Nordenberg]YP_010099620.1 endonuclease [Gordonia phage Tangent]QDH92681.1 HNH endonuclease [Gordonia phage Charming]UVF60726.1 HNH endonuclease [Gordonia phage BobBob]AXH46618.1 HNH endonuclease [Gordonia phage Rofo]AYR03099.1 HNH endonuclease [Gordonia phage Nordenberg]AYR03591.1 HNH endonuclease [Gordonia phage Tangent]